MQPYKTQSQEIFVMELYEDFKSALLNKNLISNPSNATHLFFEVLKNKCYKYSVDMHSLPESWWKKYIRTLYLCGTQKKELDLELTDAVRQINVKKVDTRSFLTFASMSVFFGLFKLAFELRKLASESSILALDEQGGTDFYRVAYGVGALYEKKRFSKIRGVIDKCTVCNDAYLKQEKLLWNILSDIGHNPQIREQISISAADVEFSQYIRGKSVAIVGPVPSEMENGNEIDSFDIVVRFNYRETGIALDPVYKGTKADVSYYNRWTSEYIIDSNFGDFPTGLKWLVNRRREHAEKIEEKLKNIFHTVAFRSRVHQHFSYIWFNGHFNAIPNAVLDLLCFEPSIIKIFHSDLMTSTSRDPGYFVPELERQDRTRLMLRSFTNVDPLSQFNLLKILFDQEKVVGDRVFSCVMGLNDIEYLDRLSIIYGGNAVFVAD